MQNRNYCIKHGKLQPCGVCKIESRQRPPQAPPIPLEQLAPTANEINVVSDAFGLERVHASDPPATPGKTVADQNTHRKKRAQPPQLKVKVRRKQANSHVSLRKQFNLSRREIAELLKKPGVDAALQPFEVRQYEQLASGNMSEDQLAKEIGMHDAVGVNVYIEDLEKRIIAEALYRRIPLRLVTPVDTDTFDRTMDADRAAQDREIAQSGGASIGASIISRGPRFGKKERSTFRPNKPLDSFDRTGGLKTVAHSDNDPDQTGGDVDWDDYSEESGA